MGKPIWTVFGRSTRASTAIFIARICSRGVWRRLSFQDIGFLMTDLQRFRLSSITYTCIIYVYGLISVHINIFAHIARARLQETWRINFRVPVPLKEYIRLRTMTETRQRNTKPDFQDLLRRKVRLVYMYQMSLHSVLKSCQQEKYKESRSIYPWWWVNITWSPELTSSDELTSQQFRLDSVTAQSLCFRFNAVSCEACRTGFFGCHYQPTRLQRQIFYNPQFDHIYTTSPDTFRVWILFYWYTDRHMFKLINVVHTSFCSRSSLWVQLPEYDRTICSDMLCKQMRILEKTHQNSALKTCY